MPGRKAPAIEAEPSLRRALIQLTHRACAQQRQVFRAHIILAAMEGASNAEIAQQLQVNVSSVSKWRLRWAACQDIPLSEMSLAARLNDASRCGAPAKISAEAYCQIMAMACQPPENFGRPITQWTARELAEEAQKQGLVGTISPRQVGRFLKRSRS